MNVEKVYWQGTDSTTPEGCHLVFGEDVMGNQRLWLYRDDALIGNVLLRKTIVHIAYLGNNSFFGVDNDASVLLRRMASL